MLECRRCGEDAVSPGQISKALMVCSSHLLWFHSVLCFCVMWGPVTGL